MDAMDDKAKDQLNQRALRLSQSAKGSPGASAGRLSKATSQTRTCRGCNTLLPEIVLTGNPFRDLVARNRDGGYCVACAPLVLADREREAQVAVAKATAERIERHMAVATIPAKMRSLTFDTLPEDFKRKPAYRAVKVWAETFPRTGHGHPSLLLHSPKPGTGKTTLASCAARAVLEKYDGVPTVMYAMGSDIGARIRSTYNRPFAFRGDGAEERETEESIYRQMAGVRLLILDDVGQEAGSDFTQRMYFSVIDERYRADMPIVLVTNIVGDDLARVIGTYSMDRLAEMTRGKVIKVTGLSRSERVNEGGSHA